MKRRVEPEWLDELPPDDPGALQSRRDLRRLNRLLGHVRILARLLRRVEAHQWIKCIVDLGAGDGTFLLGLLRCLQPECQPIKVVLVDQQPLVNAQTVAAFKALEAKVEIARADVMTWLAEAKSEAGHTVIFANLFLHHFEDCRLQQLMGQVSNRCTLFAACEPRRSALALSASRLLGFIGCNAVTRHDAVASVRAGFVGRELSALWPADGKWELIEREAGIFSHGFSAVLPATLKH